VSHLRKHLRRAGEAAPAATDVGLRAQSRGRRRSSIGGPPPEAWPSQASRVLRAKETRT